MRSFLSVISTTDEPNEALQASDHHSSSDTDSDFVRVDQSVAASNLEEHQDSAPVAAVNEDITQDINYGEGAAALPPAEEPEDHLNDSIHSSASHSGSSFSLCGDIQAAMLASPPQEGDHPHHHHQFLEEEEEEGEEDILAPSQRFHPDQILGRQYFARRLQRDMSMSVSSSASDLSTFSFLGLGHRSGKNYNKNCGFLLSYVVTQYTHIKQLL